MKTLALLAISALLAVSCVCAAQDKAFYLKSGDIVLFYGDSITEQRLYSVIVETYVATHYPDRDVTFVNSGWGGDKVSGGGGGPIDTRLKRDVFPYRPTVITIMLGMNDGNYTTETQENDEKYFSGYRHIIDSLRSNLPQARIAAIEPSPYDDITRPPTFPVSGDSLYNEVMRSFGKWIASYAKQSGLDVVDANATVVNALIQAHVSDPENAKSIIPDHVHPSFGGHLLMAGELLKAWGARPVVTGVAIDASHPAVKLESAEFATVSNLSNSGTVSWTELDEALPLPFKQWGEGDDGASVNTVIRNSDIVNTLNRQILRVKGLRSGTYSLKIDGASVAAFNNDQLAAGVNLALVKTPATDQAMKIFQLATSREEVHFDLWRNVDVPLADSAMPETRPAIDSMNSLDVAISKKMREVARPVPHRFELVPIS